MMMVIVISFAQSYPYVREKNVIRGIDIGKED